MKKNQLDELFEEIKTYYGNREYVFSIGDINPKIMLIGEAPGREELKQGKPFVGSAGKNLDKFLLETKLKRKDIYISNVFKFGLRKLNPKSGNMVNRPAKKIEIIEAAHFLLKEIQIVAPDIIVTLGNTSLWAVTNKFKLMIGEIHGEMSHIIINNHKYKFFPMYHPASIIYNRSLEEDYLKDMKKLANEYEGTTQIVD